ncbi:alpha/beta fold hydrolase [Streptomyces albidoflavus]|uniref:alpha/beta hydrolase n=1 Tax=Streptomyces albidoflavus TaxID=1886 RepID=UPI0033A7F473|nr:lysophospholipase [Streptomyces albidoflavus]
MRTERAQDAEPPPGTDATSGAEPSGRHEDAVARGGLDGLPRQGGRGKGAGKTPRAVVMLLHGGREAGLEAPPPWNLPGLRMRPFGRSIARATRGRDVRLTAVRYTHRGWNGAREDPLRDTSRALDAVAEEYGEVPVILVGHSMGGRAALRSAGHPLVRGVVGLAPWCPPGDPVTQLSGRSVVLLHSDRDHTTSPLASQTTATRARRAGARTCSVTIRGSDHAMLRRAPEWHRLTAELVTGLLGHGPLPPAVGTALALPPGTTGPEGNLDLDRITGARP